MERSGASIGNFAVLHTDLKESAAFNDDIQRVAGLGEAALAEDDLV
jgi:hypothetical protein